MVKPNYHYHEYRKHQVLIVLSDYTLVTVALTRAHKCMDRCRSWTDKWHGLAVWQHCYQLTIAQYAWQTAEYWQCVIRRQKTTTWQTPLQHLAQVPVHTHNTQPFNNSLDLVQDNPGELVPEGIFYHLLDFLLQNEDNTGRHTDNPDGLPPHPD